MTPSLSRNPPKSGYFFFFHLSQLTNLHAFRARFPKVSEHALDHFKYMKLLLYIFERRVQRFATSDTKWVNRAVTAVADPANKTPDLSSVFTCLYYI
jgi:hypothetical protein